MKIFLAVLSVFVSTCSVWSQELDYYWKDYYGDVPSDAFEAGRDVSGNPIYIGQSYILFKGLLPGTLYPGSNNLKVTAFRLAFNTNKNVKILCSQHPENLRWVSINYSDMARLTDVHLVIGGKKIFDSNLYIGRAFFLGDVQVGMVSSFPNFQGLYLPNGIGTSSRIKDFDILVYTQDNPSNNCCPLWDIDVRSNAMS